MKKVRNAVRTFLINNKNVLCIEYKNLNKGFIDIPGGKIEVGENDIQACIREFKEETGILINNLELIGKILVEYPDRIYNLKVYVAHKFIGTPQNFEDNDSYWLNINELLKLKKRFAITYLLDEEFKNDFQNKNINLKFIVNENNQILNIERLYNE